MPVILSDNSLNGYGFRVLTSGGDFSRFLKNPMLLDTHDGWDSRSIMGIWENLRVEGEQLLADPVFDEEDPRAADMKRKYDKGFLRAASIGFRVLATSEDPEDMLPGQTLPTVTKWELMEASLVPVPANANAVRLYDKDGKRIEMQQPASVALALGHTTPNHNNMSNQSESTEQVQDPREALSAAQKLLRLLGFQPSTTDSAAQGEAEKQQDSEQPELQAQYSELAAERNALKAKLEKLEGDLDKMRKLNTDQATALAQLTAEVSRLAKGEADEPADHAPDSDPAGKTVTQEKLTAADLDVRANWDAKQKGKTKK